LFDHPSGGDVAHEMIHELGLSPVLDHDHDRAAAERAYEIWENEGRPHGWEAERQIKHARRR
jgi:hypothetical protein